MSKRFTEEEIIAALRVVGASDVCERNPPARKAVRAVAHALGLDHFTDGWDHWTRKDHPDRRKT